MSVITLEVNFRVSLRKLLEDLSCRNSKLELLSFDFISMLRLLSGVVMLVLWRYNLMSWLLCI
ncbi:hypothetical protein ACSBR2_008193 [Camellia fascicularis]